MHYQVTISKPALADLGTIARFIAQSPRGSPEAALKIGEELIAVCESLATLPRRGTAVRNRPGLRKLSHRYYLIYSRTTEEPRLVEIVRIWDGRQNPLGLVLP
jgi:plasmid stabilization system protein ParE